MADKNPSPAQPVDNASSTADALVSVAGALASVVGRLEAQQPHKVPQHMALIKTPWNPSGNKDRVRLRRNTFQNGAQVVSERVSDEEITLFNKLKPGRFGTARRYVVIMKPSDRSINFVYPHATPEDRFQTTLDQKSRGLVGLLEICVNEAADRKANPVKYEKLDNGDDDDDY